MRPTPRALAMWACRFTAYGNFEHFAKGGFEFFLLPIRVHARPPAGNASRWAIPYEVKVILWIHL